MRYIYSHNCKASCDNINCFILLLYSSIGLVNLLWIRNLTNFSTGYICRNSTGYFNPNPDGVFPNPGDSRQNSEILVPSLNTSMLQDHSSFHWTSNAGSFTSQSAHDLHLAKIKEELSESFPKFSEMLNTTSSNIEDYHFPPATHIKNEQKNLNIDLSEKLLLKTISSKGFYSNAHNCASFGSEAVGSRGNFSQIYPSINISNFNQPPSAFLSSLDMNFQALDLLTTERPYSDSFGVFKEGPSFGLDQMQQLHRPSCSPSNVSNLLFSFWPSLSAVLTIEKIVFIIIFLFYFILVVVIVVVRFCYLKIIQNIINLLI